MSKLIMAVIATLVTGLAVAAWLFASPDVETTHAVTTGIEFDANASVEERLRALEAAVDAERQARQLLEDELLILYEELDAIDRQDQASQQAADAIAVGNLPPDVRRQIRRASVGTVDGRLQALTDAGFSPGRAEWITQRESALQMQVMQDRYEAMRSGASPSELRQLASADQLLRGEIGDGEYERYLQANGRPTAVDIGRVMDASPALTAGLQSGDQITHYDGTRVFNTRELIQQTMQGNPGETVVVNILRDGAPMQIVMPRGPLGINTRGRR